MRHWGRWGAACILYYSGVLALRRAASRRGPVRVLVLRYHRLLPAGTENRLYRLGVPEPVFERQIRAVPAERILGLSEAARLLDGASSVPARSGRFVVVTFDDGYADNEAAALRLARAGIPVAIFVVTGAVDSGRPFFWERLAALYDRAPRLRALPLVARRARFDAERARLKALPAEAREAELERLARQAGLQPADLERPEDRPLTWDQLRGLAASGVEVGAHTVTHPLLTQRPDAEVLAEVRGSFARLGEALGREPASFAYPTGDFDERVRRLVAGCGVRIALTCEGGENERGADLLTLRRKGVGEQVGQTPFGGFSRALWVAEIEGVFDRWRRRSRASRPVDSGREAAVREAAG